MSAIKDILDKIDKLSPTDQERLKTILLSKTFTTSILLAYVLSTLKTERNSSLSDRPALPLVAET